jgi:hypothetical protein
MYKKLSRNQILKRGGMGALKLTIKEELKRQMKPKRKKPNNLLNEIHATIAKMLLK